jgi:hypothetical protein
LERKSLMKKRGNKYRESRRFLMLHFHCYFDVQILLSHSIHFLILKRFLIGRYNFLTFFLRLSRLQCYCCYCYGALSIHALGEALRTQKKRRKEKFINVEKG